MPDYRWPSQYASGEMTPVRWLLAAVFHAAHALGRLVSFALQWIYQYEAKPTLVIRTDGIGDMLLFEPALESLARTVSPSEVHVWAPNGACQLLAECPTITRRVSVPRGGKHGNLNYFFSVFWRAKLGFELGCWSFERVIYPTESPEPLGNWLFASARTEDRWVNFGNLDNQLDWQQSRTHDVATRILEARPGNGHELARNEYIADQWAEEVRLRMPRVHLSPANAADAGRLIFAWRRAAEKQGATDLLGLVVNGTSDVNRYPTDQWAAALRRLWTEQQAMAVILGGPDDQAAMDEIAQQLGDVPHLRLIKPVHVLTMSAIIRRLDGLLSIDTGLAHVALAQRVPTVVLVSGGSPGRFFPWPAARDHIVLNVSMPCDGCGNKCHLPEASCVTKISPDEIVEAYLKLRQRQFTTIQPYVAPARKVAG